jgi:MFS family permease
MSARRQGGMKKSPLAVLYAAVLVDMMGFGIVLPLLPYYAQSLGASPMQVTLLIASFSAMQLAAAPLWGRVSDRKGRRPLLIAGLFASSVSYLLFGLADSLWLLLLSRIAAGAAGGTISVAQAYVADTTTSDERAKGMGHIGAASGLGVMLGPVIGGVFSRWGLGVPGYVAAGLCAVNGIAAIYFLPESHGHAERARAQLAEAGTLRGWLESMTRFPLSLLLGIYFLTISSFNAMTAVLALYLHHSFNVRQDAMAVVFTVAGGTTVLVRGVLLGPLIRRFGETSTARIGIVALALSMLTMSVVPNPWAAYATVPLFAFGAGTLFPTLASLVSRVTDSGSQGSVLGGSQVVGGLGRVIGPLWAGWLFQNVALNSPFRVGAMFVLLGGLLSMRIPMGRRIPTPVPPTGEEVAPGVTGA